MDKLGWIATLVAVIVAVVGVFVTIPYGATILIVAGLIAALDLPEERRIPLLVATLVLLSVSGPLSQIEAGNIIGPIVANLSIAYTGASLTVILTALVNRLKP